MLLEMISTDKPSFSTSVPTSTPPTTTGTTDESVTSVSWFYFVPKLLARLIPRSVGLSLVPCWFWSGYTRLDSYQDHMV